MRWKGRFGVNITKNYGTCWWTDSLRDRMSGAHRGSIYHSIKRQKERTAQKKTALWKRIWNGILKCKAPTKRHIHSFIHWKQIFKGSRCSKRYLNTERTDSFISNSHLWSQHSTDSRHTRHMKTRIFFPVFIFRSSSERGSMDFKLLRLCKRIALKDRRCLWRLLAGRPLAAARNSEAGLSAPQPEEIYSAPLLETGDLHRQQQQPSYVSSVQIASHICSLKCGLLN